MPAPSLRHELISRLDAGSTGALLAVLADGVTIDVFVMLGEVLAAHASDDRQQLLSLLKNTGAAESSQLAELQAGSGGGRSITEELFEIVSEDIAQDILAERFRENLFRFLQGSGPARFEELESIFVENIQTGHDSRGLVQELDDLVHATARLRGPTGLVLCRGSATMKDNRHRRLAALCSPRLPLADLLHRSPWESGRTLALVMEMLERGVLAPVTVREGDGNTAPRRSLLPPTPSLALDAISAPLARGPRGALIPSPPPPVEEFDDELAAFQDYDHDRQGGEFMTSTTHLDRVEVVRLEEAPVPRRAKPPPQPEPAPMLIEMEDAENATHAELAGSVALNFAGPKLAEDDARRKVEVVNEVLAQLVAGFDAAKGRGVGQSRAQLVIEGTPGAFAVLFKGAEVDVRGRLPVETVLKNLRKRPASEHRRLLNRGMQDVIDRALSVAGDEFEEAQLERMLEAIAGYQQRLGM